MAAPIPLVPPVIRTRFPANSAVSLTWCSVSTGGPAAGHYAITKWVLELGGVTTELDRLADGRSCG
jgi:hypothetical protein